MTPTFRRLLWATQPLLIVGVLWLALGGTHRDFKVPLDFRNDALFYLAQAKATIDHGWWWTNPALGAPSEHHALLFPQSASVDQAIVRVVGFVWKDVSPAVTVSWFIMVALSGASAAWGLRRLGVSAVGAWAAGVLFALSPFALFRNTAHFNLAPYLVPFAATAALTLATRPVIEWRSTGMRGLIAGNVLLGLNATYYAFFGVFFVMLGAIAGAIRLRLRSQLIAGTVIAGLIVVTTAANLAPTFIAWQREGQPLGVHHRVADAELYGLKVRQLITPLPGHWFPPFQTWSARDTTARFPLETENVGSRLGVVASVGFLGLLLLLLVPSLAGSTEGSETLRMASGLVLAAILLATVGGIGSVISELVSSEIRSYTRITPFIAFFSLTAVGLWIDRATTRQPPVRVPVWGAVLILGLFDQAVGVRPLNAAAAATKTEFRQVHHFVDLLEQRLPAGAMVFQLPIRPYPVDGGVEHMGAYDHFRPYLVSRQLRWSYPALSDVQVRRDEARSAGDPRSLPTGLAREGFSAIVVDRFGYADNGEAVIAALQTIPEQAAFLAQTDRYLALDLRFANRPAR